MPRGAGGRPLAARDFASAKSRLAKVQRDLRLARANQKDQARRDDARRKIIAGALALEHREKNPDSEFGKRLFKLLDEYARPEDRRLFEFLPVRDAPPQTDITDVAE
jgi:hypothetical protein